MPAHAQLAPQDMFGGRTDVSGPLRTDRMAASCQKLSNTSETCAVTGATITGPSNPAGTSSSSYVTTYNVAVGGNNYTIALGEAMCGDSFGTGNIMNYSPQQSNVSATEGADIVSTITTGSPGTIQLNTFQSGTQSATSGYIRPCYAHPETVATPFGTGPQWLDPLNNWLWIIGVGNACLTGCGSQYAATLTAKYGSNDCTTASYLEKDFADAHFTAAGFYSENYYTPTSGTGGTNCQYSDMLPGFSATADNRMADGAAADRYGLAPLPLHDLSDMIDQSTNGSKHGAPDLADPNFPAYALSAFGTTYNSGGTGYANFLQQYQSPLNIGKVTDDTDNDGFGNPGWVFHAYNGSGGKANENAPGYYAFAVDPHGAYVSYNTTANFSIGSQLPQLYPTDTVFTKKLTGATSCFSVSSPTTPPCSVPDYLAVEYGYTGGGNYTTALANLNAAWGSQFTTFGSSETAVSGESPSDCNNSCVGDGTTTVFTFNFNNGNVTPGSVHVFVDGNMVAADCPTSWAGAGCGGLAGGGRINSPILCLSTNLSGSPGLGSGFECSDNKGGVEQSQSPNATIQGAANFSGWATTIGNTASWGSATMKMIGPAVTSGSGSAIAYGATSSAALTFAVAPPSGATITVSYTYDGWSTGHGTGIQDMDGSGAAGWASGTVNTSGTTVTETSTANFVTGTAWVGMLAKVGTSNCTIASVTSTSVLTCTASMGTQTGVAFQANGMGTNAVCPVHIYDWQPSTSYPIWSVIDVASNNSAQIATNAGTSGSGSEPAFSNNAATVTSDNGIQWASLGTQVCGNGTGADFAEANDQTQLGLDVNNYLTQIAAYYYQTGHNTFASVFPGWNWLGIDSLGNYNHPPMGQVLQVANLFTQGDSLGMTLDTTLPSGTGNPLAFLEYQYASYFIQRPLIPLNFYTTIQSPTGNGNASQCSNSNFASVCYSSQAARGGGWYIHVYNLLHTLGYNNIFETAGTQWAECDVDCQGSGFGFKTNPGDNMEDGVEDVASTSVTCGNGIGPKCGGEPYPASTVSVNFGSPTVTWVSGPTFPAPNTTGFGGFSSASNNPVQIGGSPYTVSSIGSTTSLTLTANFSGTSGTYSFEGGISNLWSTAAGANTLTCTNCVITANELWLGANIAGKPVAPTKLSIFAHINLPFDSYAVTKLF